MKKLFTVFAITTVILFSSNVFAQGTDFLTQEIILEKVLSYKILTLNIL